MFSHQVHAPDGPTFCAPAHALYTGARPANLDGGRRVVEDTMQHLGPALYALSPNCKNALLQVLVITADICSTSCEGGVATSQGALKQARARRLFSLWRIYARETVCTCSVCRCNEEWRAATRTPA
jgi:hypothetical protein